MTTYVASFFTAVSSALEFNSATLSGAIDIIVIEDEHGKRQCSPFHVRFGKLQLLKSRGIPVDIELNGKKTDLRMYLGSAGEAYFYDIALAESKKQALMSQTSKDSSKGDSPETRRSQIAAESPDIDLRNPSLSAPELESLDKQTSGVEDQVQNDFIIEGKDSSSGDLQITSCPSVELAESESEEMYYTRAIRNTSDIVVQHFGYLSDSEVELTRAERDGTTEVVDEPRSPPLFNYQRKWSIQWARGRSALRRQSRSEPIRDGSFVENNYESEKNSKLMDSLSESAVLHGAIPEEHGDEIPRSVEGDGSSLFGLPGYVQEGSSPATSSETLKKEVECERKIDDSQDADLMTHKVRRDCERDISSTEVMTRTYESPVTEDNGELALEIGQATSDTEGRVADQATLPEDVDVYQPAHEIVTLSVSGEDVDQEEDKRLDCRSVDGDDADDRLLEGTIAEHLAKALRENDEKPSRFFSPGASSSYSLQRNENSAFQVSANPDEPETECEGSEERSDICTQDDENDTEGVITMSLCGSALQKDMAEEDIITEFEKHLVTRAQFEDDPNVLYNRSLLFRIEDRIVDFRVAAPFVMAMLAYKTPLDIDRLSQMMEKPADAEPQKEASPAPSRRFGGWFWSSPSVEGEPLLDEDFRDEITPIELKDSHAVHPNLDTQEKDNDGNHSHESGLRPSSGEEDILDSTSDPDTNLEGDNTVTATESLVAEQNEDVNTILERDESAEEDIEADIFADADYESEFFSFLPTINQLQKLDLKPGANEIRFIVPARNAELRCRVFLWGNDSKIVISDVDGTITRSDVLGHLLPAVGRDWSQVGVAALYSQIEKNGYKILYLTARPIGQASQTRDFLHSVAQENARLPNGPVLMSPNRLVESFTREVIRRKPHEFKIAALREIRSLFPPTYNPFHAGFGNRDTDVISYRAVGLIPQRIFVVNHRGELVVMKAMYESTASYSSLQALVENVFPDITRKAGQELVRHVTESAVFNDWKYWESSLPEVDLDALAAGNS